MRLITASQDGVNEHQKMERRGRPRSITPDRHLGELSESETDWFGNGDVLQEKRGNDSDDGAREGKKILFGWNRTEVRVCVCV